MRSLLENAPRAWGVAFLVRWALGWVDRENQIWSFSSEARSFEGVSREMVWEANAKALCQEWIWDLLCL